MKAERFELQCGRLLNDNAINEIRDEMRVNIDEGIGFQIKVVLRERERGACREEESKKEKILEKIQKGKVKEMWGPMPGFRFCFSSSTV